MQTKLSPARKAALDALIKAEATSSYVRELFAHGGAATGLDARDAAFALRLALGVTATEGCLDDALNQHLAKPKDVETRVRMALRIAAYEVLYLKTAPEIVVSQGVELVRSCAYGAAGLANAVLRRVCENRESFFAAEDAAPAHQRKVSAARKAGLPVWLTRRIEASVGESAARDLFAAQLEPAPIAVQINPLCETELEDALTQAGAVALALPGSYEVAHVAALAESGAFSCADVVASDYHAQLIAAAATRAGSCLEIGAGRGTKTYMMLAHALRVPFTHDHVALDLYEGKCRANKERIEQAGLGALRALAGDACNLDEALSPLDAEAGERVLFDTVFVDAPCSGTGTMRRHVEIPWRTAPQTVDKDLPQLQLTMLNEAARRVAPGGELIYATCSVLVSENEDVVTAFLNSEAGALFKPAPLSQADIFTKEPYRQAAQVIAAHETPAGFFRTSPAIGAYDGHFCARMLRRA